MTSLEKGTAVVVVIVIILLAFFMPGGNMYEVAFNSLVLLFGVGGAIGLFSLLLFDLSKRKTRVAKSWPNFFILFLLKLFGGAEIELNRPKAKEFKLIYGKEAVIIIIVKYIICLLLVFLALRYFNII